MKILAVLLFQILFMTLGSGPAVRNDVLAPGEQPQISADNKGVIRVVYGLKDKIFCSTSEDQGITFSKPVFVAQLPDMHLGMSRGPQLASSGHYSIITAMDKSGNIHWYRLDPDSKEWRNTGMVNDLQGSAPEGLMSIAADHKDNFYAVWLDTRAGSKNQICFASISGKATHWSANSIAYQSPDGHVCECCRPSISVQGSEVALMFRNWLNGSRDLYLVQSSDGGKSFRQAQKLGTGTWKLNGCPMDGGGVLIEGPGTVHTVWRREGTVYYCKPGEPETDIGKGSTCSIAGTAGKTIISLQEKDTLKLLGIRQKDEIIVGTGAFMRSVVLQDNKVLCVWEQEKVIKFKRI